MKCPVCHKTMKQVRKDVSRNPSEKDKEYDRTVYQCEADDVWANTEVPRNRKVVSS